MGASGTPKTQYANGRTTDETAEEGPAGEIAVLHNHRCHLWIIVARAWVAIDIAVDQCSACMWRSTRSRRYGAPPGPTGAARLACRILRHRCGGRADCCRRSSDSRDSPVSGIHVQCNQRSSERSVYARTSQTESMSHRSISSCAIRAGGNDVPVLGLFVGDKVAPTSPLATIDAEAVPEFSSRITWPICVPVSLTSPPYPKVQLTNCRARRRSIRSLSASTRVASDATSVAMATVATQSTAPSQVPSHSMNFTLGGAR